MTADRLTDGDRARIRAALELGPAPEYDEPDSALLLRARTAYQALYDALGVTTPVSAWMLAADPDEVPQPAWWEWDVPAWVAAVLALVCVAAIATAALALAAVARG